MARPELFPAFRPALPAKLERKTELDADMMAAVREGDILLYHPFQSFQPVIAFLEQAARDPNVVAIKMTVYRTGAESELMEILITAARSGKEVTVVLELLARFDEEANINWPSGWKRWERTWSTGGRAQDPRQDAVGQPRGRRCGAMHLSTATTIREPPLSYTDWGCSRAMKRSAPT